MNDLNEIETIKSEKCIIHICDDMIVTSKEKQEKIWKEFSESAYRLCMCINNIEK